MNWGINNTLQERLNKRKDNFLYRELQVNEGLIDFCSNDYLSFSKLLAERSGLRESPIRNSYRMGATGSRSISGNSVYAEALEQSLAQFHNADAGLLFNSGYDANLGLFSSIAAKGDTILCDELIHASIIDGCRLSYANRLRFAHNDVSDLEKKLQQSIGNIFVAVESVYSMDGDMAPLREIVNLCRKYSASLIVDEAHATGIFGKQGRGLANQYRIEQDAFARIHTFGKALGCHGAIIVGSTALRNYLINFARSFIFTTALPIHTLQAVKAAYHQLMEEDFSNDYLHQLIEYFKKDFITGKNYTLINSITPIQSVIVPGNKAAKTVSGQLQTKGFDCRAIVSPSVPLGKERLRISLHMHNTFEQVSQLKELLFEILST